MTPVGFSSQESRLKPLPRGKGYTGSKSNHKQQIFYVIQFRANFRANSGLKPTRWGRFNPGSIRFGRSFVRQQNMTSDILTVVRAKGP